LSGTQGLRFYFAFKIVPGLNSARAERPNPH